MAKRKCNQYKLNAVQKSSARLIQIFGLSLLLNNSEKYKASIVGPSKGAPFSAYNDIYFEYLLKPDMFLRFVSVMS